MYEHENWLFAKIPIFVEMKKGEKQTNQTSKNVKLHN